MSNVRVVYGVVTTKNATLMVDEDRNYILQHYDTIVFATSNGIITKCSNKTNNDYYSKTTSKIVGQVLERLRLPKDTKVGDRI